PRHRDLDPPRSRSDRQGRRRDADLLRLRRARLRVGHDVGDDPPARRAHRAARSRQLRQPRRSVRRPRGRIGYRRPARRAVGRHGTVLVRLRGLGHLRGAHLARAASLVERGDLARGGRRRPGGLGPQQHVSLAIWMRHTLGPEARYSQPREPRWSASSLARNGSGSWSLTSTKASPGARAPNAPKIFAWRSSRGRPRTSRSPTRTSSAAGAMIWSVSTPALVVGAWSP